MARAILFVGGVRSGKTRLAEKWAMSIGLPCLMLATCQCRDAEMAARIAAHKKGRGDSWLCLEEPLDLIGGIQAFLKRNPDFKNPVVVDSLGMWINNLMESGLGEKEIIEKSSQTLKKFASLDLPCAFVSEECGLGFVPMSNVARLYGDVLGAVNQIAAQMVDTVIFASCGLPLVIKGRMPASLG